MNTDATTTLRTLVIPADIDETLRRGVAEDASDRHPDLKLIGAWRSFVAKHANDTGILPYKATGGVRLVKPAAIVQAQERAFAAGLLELSKVPPAFTPDEILRLQTATHPSRVKEPAFDRAAKGLAGGLSVAALAKGAAVVSRRTLFKLAGAAGAGGGLLLTAGGALAYTCSGNCQYYGTWCDQGTYGYDGIMDEEIDYYWDYYCSQYCGTSYYHWCTTSCPCANHTPLECCWYYR